MKRRNLIKSGLFASAAAHLPTAFAKPNPPILLGAQPVIAPAAPQGSVFGSLDFQFEAAMRGGGRWSLPSLHGEYLRYRSIYLEGNEFQSTSPNWGARLYAPEASKHSGQQRFGRLDTNQNLSNNFDRYDWPMGGLIFAKHLAREANGDRSEDAFFERHARGGYDYHMANNRRGNFRTPGADHRDNYHGVWLRAVGEYGDSGDEFVRNVDDFAMQPAFAKFGFYLNEAWDYRASGGNFRRAGHLLAAHCYRALALGQDVFTASDNGGPKDTLGVNTQLTWLEPLFENTWNRNIRDRADSVAHGLPNRLPYSGRDPQNPQVSDSRYNRHAPFYMGIMFEALMDYDEFTRSRGEPVQRWWRGRTWPTPMHAAAAFIVDLVEGEQIKVQTNVNEAYLDSAGRIRYRNAIGRPLVEQGFSPIPHATPFSNSYAVDERPGANRSAWAVRYQGHVGDDYHPDRNVRAGWNNETKRGPGPFLQAELNTYLIGLYYRMGKHVAEQHGGICPQTGKDVSWFVHAGDSLLRGWTQWLYEDRGHGLYPSYGGFGKSFGQAGLYMHKAFRARKHLALM
ncbi:MAG: hypothetical protein AAGG11_21635 [Pseudomonadota bacterium]